MTITSQLKKGKLLNKLERTWVKAEAKLWQDRQKKLLDVLKTHSAVLQKVKEMKERAIQANKHDKEEPPLIQKNLAEKNQPRTDLEEITKSEMSIGGPNVPSSNKPSVTRKRSPGEDEPIQKRKHLCLTTSRCSKDPEIQINPDGNCSQETQYIVPSEDVDGATPSKFESLKEDCGKFDEASISKIVSCPDNIQKGDPPIQQLKTGRDESRIQNGERTEDPLEGLIQKKTMATHAFDSVKPSRDAVVSSRPAQKNSTSAVTQNNESDAMNINNNSGVKNQYVDLTCSPDVRGKDENSTKRNGVPKNSTATGKPVQNDSKSRQIPLPAKSPQVPRTPKLPLRSDPDIIDAQSIISGTPVFDRSKKAIFSSRRPFLSPGSSSVANDGSIVGHQDLAGPSRKGAEIQKARGWSGNRTEVTCLKDVASVSLDKLNQSGKDNENLPIQKNLNQIDGIPTALSEEVQQNTKENPYPGMHSIQTMPLPTTDPAKLHPEKVSHHAPQDSVLDPQTALAMARLSARLPPPPSVVSVVSTLSPDRIIQDQSQLPEISSGVKGPQQQPQQIRIVGSGTEPTTKTYVAVQGRPSFQPRNVIVSKPSFLIGQNKVNIPGAKHVFGQVAPQTQIRMAPPVSGPAAASTSIGNFGPDKEEKVMIYTCIMTLCVVQ